MMAAGRKLDFHTSPSFQSGPHCTEGGWTNLNELLLQNSGTTIVIGISGLELLNYLRLRILCL